MSKRKLVWARRVQNTALVAAASAAWVDLLAEFRVMMGITANIPGTTVSRVRMDCFSANLSAGGFPTTVGLRVMTIREFTEAQADPAYALNLSPLREPGADWMYWRALYPNHGADPTTGVPNALTYELDVRSMRRLDEAQETLAYCVSKEASTGGYTHFNSASVLLALP